MNAIERIDSFYQHDINIKKAMQELAPDPYYLMDNDYITRYVENSADLLKYIYSEIREIVKEVYDDSIVDTINSFFNNMMTEFAECGYDGYKLNMFYINRISDMRPSFVAQVAQTLHGSYVFRNPYSTIHEAKTINELLHSMHRNVVENDMALSQEINSEEFEHEGFPDPSYIYGNNNEFARGMMNSILNSGINDEVEKARNILLLSVNDNRYILMLRGLGHLTCIELEVLEDSEVRVSYHVPKICNIDMINQLKGVSKVKSNVSLYTGTSGIFYSNKEELMNDLLQLIKGIPTDRDIVNTFEIEQGRSM